MSTLKTFRLLKPDQTDRIKVEKLFADKSDELLLGAIANPEHSEAARQILRELADQRGLQKAVGIEWAQTEKSMYVAPFGRQPSFEEVLAAPGRRRLIYRSLQFMLLASMVLGVSMFFQLGPFKNQGQQVINPADVDPATTARLRQLEPPPTDQEINAYLDGRKLFANDLRQAFVDLLVEDEAIDQLEFQPYLQADDLTKNDANMQIIDIYNGQLGDSTEYDEYMRATKDQAYFAGLNAFIDGADDNVLEATHNFLSFELDYIRENNDVDNNLRAFDYFEKSARLKHPDPLSVNVGLALILAGPLLWFFGGIFSWIRPYRILLLRPFQSKKVSGSLRRFMRKNISFYGHAITLSDTYVKESLFDHVIFWIPRSAADLIVIPIFFIPAVRQFKRWIKVHSAGSYGFLQNRLARRFTMNMFWQHAFSKLLKVKCSDTWWKQTVDLLMYSSHLIVVDLSLVKVGTEWELDKINSRDLERKTIFVVGEDSEDYAREVIARFWPDDEAPPPLYVYTHSGTLPERTAYQRDLARIISESHLWKGVPETAGPMSH